MIASWRNLAIASGVAVLALGGFASICYLMIEPKSGMLELSISEPGTEVKVVDPDESVEYHQKTERNSLNIPLGPGKHRLDILKEGFTPFSQEFELQPGTRHTLTAKLTGGRAARAVHGEETVLDESLLDFVEIFNGKDLTGWDRVGPVDAWSVDANTKVLTASGAGGEGWLLTQKEYGDFLLRLEYQLTPGSNSGIALLADPKDPHHLEVQLANLDFYPSGALWTNPGNREHGGYLPPHFFVREQPNNSWHRLSLEVRDQRVKVTINGVLVAQYELDELAKMPGAHDAFKRDKGRIGLQSQLKTVRFRNVKIAHLDAEALKKANFAKAAKTPEKPQALTEAASPLAGAAASPPETWMVYGDYWTLKNGELSGSSVNRKHGFNTFYYSKKSYANFELTCQAKLLKGNSGIQIRSVVENAKLGIMKGPQADMERGSWGSLYGERLSGVMQAAPERFEDREIKTGEFNDMYIRCVGKRITLKINGKTCIDREFPGIALSGLIGFQLGHGETDVVFRDTKITELQNVSELPNANNTEMPEKGEKALTLAEVGSPLTNAATKPPETWVAYGDFWRIKNGELSGSSLNRRHGFNTFYYGKKSYQDFELTCQAKLLRGNSGIQIRSEVEDAKLGIMKGPQADMEMGSWGSLYGERMNGVIQAAPSRFEYEVVKNNEFNDISIRCVGKRVTLKINGKTSIDRDFPEIASNGLIGFQLGHGETEVVFRNIQVTELKNVAVMPSVPEKPRTLAEAASPLAGTPAKASEPWFAYGDFWNLKNGELSGSSIDKRLGFNTFYYGKKSYQDFELTCQAKLLRGNSGIQIRSELEDAKLGIMKGPQLDMERGAWGSLYGERMSGVMQEAPKRFESEAVKAEEFNDLSIRCVGKRITIKINGKTSIDREFPEIAATGLIGFQLGHGETEVVFRNIQITELNK